VRRIGRGDREAETLLWKRFQRVVLGMLRQRTRLPDVAKDLWHDTYIFVLEKLRSGTLEDPTKLAAYVQQTAAYVHLGWLRKEVRRKTSIDCEIAERFPSSTDTPPCVVQHACMVECLRSLIGEMNVERDRQILIGELSGVSKTTLCRMLDLTPTHFDRVRSRARKRLGDLLIAKGVSRDHLRPWLEDDE